MDEWTGLYAMPVPESVTELPEEASAGDLSMELATWEYGEVAQILHVGRWDQEEPTVERLKEFIESKVKPKLDSVSQFPAFQSEMRHLRKKIDILEKKLKQYEK